MAIDSRPFKEIDDQIDGLACRGLTIENRSHTFDVLLRNNYYCVINGYKRPFLKKDMSGNFLFPSSLFSKSINLSIRESTAIANPILVVSCFCCPSFFSSLLSFRLNRLSPP